jgi:aryl-alcohol dehydrogenase
MLAAMTPDAVIEANRIEAVAAVLRSSGGTYRVEPISLPEPGREQVLVRVAGTGFCHTDRLPRARGLGIPVPVITGHEGAGVVEAVGPGVRAIRPGDHVVLSFDSCGRCRNCHSGQPAYCEWFWRHNLSATGVDGDTARDVDGVPIASRWFGQSSFATHCLAAERSVVIVDRDLPLQLLGPLGCSVQTGAGSVMLALRVSKGDTIAVSGAGGVGLPAIIAAQLAGAGTIVAVDPNPARRALAHELGATHTLDPVDPELAPQIRELTSGGVDFALDTTGRPDAIRTAIDSLRLTGICGLVGIQRDALTLAPDALIGRRVIGIIEGNAVPQLFIPRLIKLWRQGLLPFDRLIETFGLAEIDAAERASVEGAVIKPVVIP